MIILLHKKTRSRNQKGKSWVKRRQLATKKKVNGTTTPINDKDDDTLLKEAEEYYSKQSYVKASNCFKRIQDVTKLTDQHKRTIQLADLIESLLNEVLVPVSDATHSELNGWTRQTEVHDEFDTYLHYKVDPKTYQLTSRIESIIDTSLLVPLCAVMNESELYSTWMPKWTFPFTMGVDESTKLGEYSVGHQIVQVKVKMPYPLMTNRQVIQHAIACDCIDDDINNCIVIRIDTMDTGVYHEITIPEPPRSYKRVDMNGGFVIRACPNDHPLLVHRKEKLTTQKSKNEKNEVIPEEENAGTVEEEEPSMLLVTNIMTVDSHVTFVPTRLINFFTRTALVKLWHALLNVAVEVRDGARPNIQECIATKSDLYDWTRARTSVMIANLQKQQKLQGEKQK